jgi:C_GCAxxG_C_C family probable redox protein
MLASDRKSRSNRSDKIVGYDNCFNDIDIYDLIKEGKIGPDYPVAIRTKEATMDKKSQVSKTAFEYHKSGFHCAEAMTKAFMDVYGNGSDPTVQKVASAFGGGIGRTKQELCGALAGGFIALGYLHGRSKPTDNWDELAHMAAELRHKFEAEHGTTRCSALLETFGPQENMMRCKQLTGEVAGMLAEILEAHRKA